MKTTERRFNGLLVEAVTVEQEYERLTADGKLSARAFLRQAFEVAETNAEKLAELRRRIAEGRDKFPAATTFVRNAVKWIREGTCTRFPRELRRLTWLAPYEALAGEMGQLGARYFSLFAVAVAIAAEQRPEAFGGIEDAAQYDAKVRELSTRRVELRQELARSYALEDLLIGRVETDGRAAISMKLSGGAVALAPAESLGERLVSFILTQPEIERALRSPNLR